MGGRDDIVPDVEEGVKDRLLLVCAQLWKYAEKIEQETVVRSQKAWATAGEHGGERSVIAFVYQEEE